MSGFLDSLTPGGYDGSADGGIGDSSGVYFPTSQPSDPSNSGNYASGFLQNLTALGTGYLAKRLDVDLQSRVVGMQAYPNLRTTQNGIGYGAVTRTPNGQQVATVNLSAMMPIIVVAAVAFFLARRT